MEQQQKQITGYWDIKTDTYDETRKPDELRPIQYLNNKLTRANGSVELRQGNTLILCTINGPLDCERAKQIEDKAYIELNLHLVQPQPSSIAHELMHSLYHQQTYDSYLRKHLMEIAEHVIDVQQHPRCKIAVSFEIVHHDGSLLSLCSNALLKCVINSGISAKTTFLSFTVAKIIHNGETIYKFDPTLADEAYAKGLLTMTIENPKFIHDFSTGISQDKTQYLMELLQDLSKPSEKALELRKKFTKLQIEDMQAKVQEEPQIIQLISQKQWTASELEYAMGLVIEKWVRLAAELRE